LAWEDLSPEMGCGSGMTCWRRLRDWHQAGVWQTLHETLPAKLEAAHQIDWSRASVDSIFIRARGAKKGGLRAGGLRARRLARRLWTGARQARSAITKRHQVVDRNGLPLATVLSGANVADGKRLLAVVDAIPFVRGKRGRPRHRPEKVHADKAYDDRKLRRGLRRRGIGPRIACRSLDSSQTLGRHRWVAERTFSWQQAARRLRVRDERRDDIYEAFVMIENALICWGRINDHFC